MKRALAAGFVALVAFSLAPAQKRSTILGDAWTGEVVSTDDGTREITIKFEEKGKTGTFTGALVEGYKVKTEDGGEREFRVSEIPAGMRVRVFPKTREQIVAGRKAKVSVIHRIDFLGLDEFSRLRAVLRLKPTAPVSLDEAGGLPAARPLKMHLAIDDERIRAGLIDWANEWNGKQAAKHGPLEIVPALAEADVSLVVLRGSESLVAVPPVSIVIGGELKDVYLAPLTVFLVSRKNDGLEVLWKQRLLGGSGTGVEKELEKRMKARSKK